MATVPSHTFVPIRANGTESERKRRTQSPLSQRPIIATQNDQSASRSSITSSATKNNLGLGLHRGQASGVIVKQTTRMGIFVL